MTFVCCNEYSNVEYQYEIFIKKDVQKQMAKSGLERDFHDLNYFELDFFIALKLIIHWGHNQMYFGSVLCSLFC